MPLALSAAPGLLLHYRVILRTPGPVGTVCAHSLAPRAYSHLTDGSCSWRAVHQGDQRLRTGTREVGRSECGGPWGLIQRSRHEVRVIRVRAARSKCFPVRIIGGDRLLVGLASR